MNTWQVEKPTAGGICFSGQAPPGLTVLSHIALWLFFVRCIHEAPDQTQMSVCFESSSQPFHSLKGKADEDMEPILSPQCKALQRILLSYNAVLGGLTHPAYLHSALHYHAA